jgi:hypothetical protein
VLGQRTEERLPPQRCPVDLPDRETTDLHPDQPTGDRPAVGEQIVSDRPGHDEAAWPERGVDRSFDRTEHARSRLPLVEEYRLAKTSQGDVRVGLELGGLGRAIEPDHARRVPRGRRSLARRARANEEHGRHLGHQSVDHRIRDSRQVALLHRPRVPLS